jgi:hypothetical protein
MSYNYNDIKQADQMGGQMVLDIVLRLTVGAEMVVGESINSKIFLEASNKGTCKSCVSEQRTAISRSRIFLLCRKETVGLSEEMEDV